MINVSFAAFIFCSPFDEGESEDAESPQVVDADAGGLRDGERARRRRPRRAGRLGRVHGVGRRVGGRGRAVAGDGGGLGGGRRVGRRRLLLHLAVALAEVEHLEELRG